MDKRIFPEIEKDDKRTSDSQQYSSSSTLPAATHRYNTRFRSANLSKIEKPKRKIKKSTRKEKKITKTVVYKPNRATSPMGEKPQNTADSESYDGDTEFYEYEEMLFGSEMDQSPGTKKAILEFQSMLREWNTLTVAEDMEDEEGDLHH